jgi:hypothetical protein
MRCEFLGRKGTWREVANSANTTISLGAGDNEPTSKWKRRILLAEHSPIRQLWVKAKWYDLKSWVSVHFCRHFMGINHYVRSQRPDRGVTNRDEAPQSTLIEHEFDVNAQAMINISRRRLCNMAMPETREAWRAFLDSVKDKEPELVSVCVRECVYRNGFCPEFKTCKFNLTEEFKKELDAYLDGY